MPLRPRDVGQRVVVRYLLAEPDPGGSATDVLGRLVACDADGVEVETEAGERVRVPAGRLVAGRPVPARATTRLRVGPDALQRVCDRGWPAASVQPLGEWLLRAAGGFTGRANSVLPAGDPGRPFPEALAAVEAFYRGHGLPALAQVVMGSPVERLFGHAGWEPVRYGAGVLVQVASVAQAHRAGRRGHLAPRAAHRSSGAPVVDLLDRPDPAWMGVYGRTAGVAADVVAGVLAGPPVVTFAAVGAGQPGGPVAIGRGVVTDDWLGLSAVEVVPARRRGGLADRVVDALLGWGAEHGAVSAYLQTVPDNEAARALYEPYGFVTHHRYRYLAPAPGARSRQEPGPGPAR